MPDELMRSAERLIGKMATMSQEQREKILIFIYGVEAGAAGKAAGEKSGS